jgi:cephalosporin hydroxylase
VRPNHRMNPVALSVMDRDELARRFAELWWSEKRTTLFANRWLGVPTLQHPFDAWVTQEIICEVRPDLIIECGSYHGGSAVMWAMVLEQVSPSGRVLTIDVEDRLDRARSVPVFARRVEALCGSSVDPLILEQVQHRAAGKRTLVILDSDHAKDHVAAELEAYAPLVTPGSYLIVQDGVVNGHPVEPEYGPGPFEAVADFLERNQGFAIDSTRERMLFTFNPNGFLRRVR